MIEPVAVALPRDRRRGAPVVDRALQVTLELLAEQGLAGVSVPEVARRAGLNKTSLYRRWPSREDLIRAALSHGLGHDAPIPDTGSLEGDLVAFATGAVRFAETPLGKGAVRTLLGSGGGLALREVLAPMLQAGTEGPRALLLRAQARGELRETADVDLALSVVAGTLLQRLFVEQAPVDEAFLRTLARFVVAGLAPR